MTSVCVHGHFYQPDRTDPWTGRVPAEPGAAPFHDWNERIDAECYRPNAAARLLGSDGRIREITSNYERMSWNVGPSLLGWLEQNDPWTLNALIEADRRGRERFGGHGPALAQPWVHAILPLCEAADRRTLIQWGLADFEHRFGRPSEGMWLPETAVDSPTLRDLAAAGVAFTVLAPWQVRAVAPPGGDWTPVAGDVDTTRSYRCDLSTGESIALWCYDGALSAGIAFNGWLDDGTQLAQRLALDGRGPGDRDALVHVATDGESYGHHHRWGEMALAAALAMIEDDPTRDLTVYGEHLERFPPVWRAQLAERTAWSCAHGIDRWRADCGCQTGGPEGWTQEWRRPLRSALDWLRGALAAEFEDVLAPLLDDPWSARDDYGALLATVWTATSEQRDRDTEAFVERNSGDPTHRGVIIGAMEMQRHLLQSFESSAWFYADAAGPEAVLALRHAARAIEWCEQLTGHSLVEAFVARLSEVRSNDAEIGSGDSIWHHLVVGPPPAVPARPGPDDQASPARLVEAVDRIRDAIDDLVDPSVRPILAEAIETTVRVDADRLEAAGDDRRELDTIAERILAVADLAGAFGLAELPGRWWIQNAVVAVRDRWAEDAQREPTGALVSLADRVGVDLSSLSRRR